MKKAIIHQFDSVIYPIKLFVSITDNLSGIADKLEEYPSGKPFKTKGANKMEAFTQLVSEKESGYIGVLILFKSKTICSVKLIAHEASHASDKIWNHLGETHPGSGSNAYLVGWIAECCWKVKLNKF